MDTRNITTKHTQPFAKFFARSLPAAAIGGPPIMDASNMTPRHTKSFARFLARSLPVAAIVGASIVGAGPLASIASAAPPNVTPKTCAGYNVTIRGTDGNDKLFGTAKRDVIHGGLGNDAIYGSGGDDVICGGDGDDQIAGQAGNDLLDGGNGNDRVTFASAPAAVIVDLFAKSASGEGSDTVVNMENITGTRFDDQLTGNDGPNNIVGLAGIDAFWGLKGNDVLIGNEDAPGAVREQDQVQYWRSEGAVTVRLGGLSGTSDKGYATGGEDVDTLIGFASVVGSRYNDVLVGDAYDNSFVGYTGGDSIDGGGGVDLVKYNWLFGGVVANLSTVPGTASQGWVADPATGTKYLSTPDDKDTLVRIEALTGSAYDDDLTGSAGRDLLTGRAGNDIINGMGGDDELAGSEGTDTCDGGPQVLKDRAHVSCETMLDIEEVYQ